MQFKKEVVLLRKRVMLLAYTPVSFVHPFLEKGLFFKFFSGFFCSCPAFRHNSI
jgi:hypothetical protein